MNDLASFTASIRGRVQGVFFRAFTQGHASQLGISGYVRNLPDGSVEVSAEGERSQLELLAGHLRVGPPMSTVTEVVINWSGYTGEYADFRIKY